MSSQGKTLFSIPLKSGKNEQMPIRKVQLAYENDWQSQLLKTLRTLYQATPYYEHYIDSLEAVVMNRHEHLFSHNMSILQWVIDMLKITPNITCTLEYKTKYPAPIVDLRNDIHPKANLLHEWYPQTFENLLTESFNLSVLDLIFNLGPESRLFLDRMSLASQYRPG